MGTMTDTRDHARGANPRALVVDDSSFMRTMIGDILTDGGVEVVGTASDGAEAVEKVLALAPDVVTMDIHMDGMSGVEAVERIMDVNPTPILMLSAHACDSADVTFTALEKGAVDFFTKPGGEISTGLSSQRSHLVETVKSVASADVSEQPRATSAVSPLADDARSIVDRPTVVIGSSTGGPRVVERIVRTLPISAGLRVLIVQHMPDEFTGRFAKRLDLTSQYQIREAQHGARIGAGEGVVARGGRHLSVTHYSNGRIRVALSDDPPMHSVKPAIDVTMQSAAAVIDDPLVGVILTGMGQDGALGLQKIGEIGGHTIAQDEATSTVYGMPRRAVETGCVDHVVPLDDVAPTILDVISVQEVDAR